MIPNVAPCGSRRTARRPTFGTSIGSMSAEPPSSFALRLVRADERALRVGDDCDAPDLAHLERSGRELAAGALRLLDRLVDVLDPDVREPVRRGCSLHGLAEAAVALSA